ncbi:proline dehydrogenase family protein [Longimicrobium sp.]|uniref:proline dehydrogenase family protein n=1 Tax=Longimicrobium sp. TaxID=2029185 RepID=UPI002E30725F|nr:proline dehydrogenase family protein [Longimicrobium sp.]HEX6038547.1 proline dehydrogenase family protein [Longimicrobium sp.]
MLKTSLLRLSESNTAKKIITRAPLSRSFAQRFVAGDTLDEALQAARELNEAGLTVSLDFLGESVASRDEAEAAARMAVRILESIQREGLQANLSIKPTQLGLDIDEAFCRGNVETVLRRARELGDGEGEIFVRLDMESSAYTERTVTLVESLWADGFRNVGTVLQSMLRRTPDDLERMIALDARVRLVKGAYQEPESVAHPDKADVDRAYVDGMKRLLEAGRYPAIATHDEAVIDAARRFVWERGIDKSSFEFQMLYGVRRDLQTRLREEGYNVRVYVPFGDSWYPYLMRRLAERPANVLFMAGSIVKEARGDAGLRKPAMAVGAGIVAGVAAVLFLRRRK